MSWGDSSMRKVANASVPLFVLRDRSCVHRPLSGSLRSGSGPGGDGRVTLTMPGWNNRWTRLQSAEPTRWYGALSPRIIWVVAPGHAGSQYLSESRPVTSAREGRMPLSDHEQRMLDQIESALYAEDPKFASSVRGGSLRAPRMW